MVGARFCHACGCARQDSPPIYQNWTRYLEFHTIKQGALDIRQALGLPLPSLVCFLLGMLLLVIAVLVGVVYPIENIADFQAVQLWRMQWLLGGVAVFLAGILLKRPSPPQK
jgi:hypothetical protein